MTRLVMLLLFLASAGCGSAYSAKAEAPDTKEPEVSEKEQFTCGNLREKLTPEQYHVTQEKGTEFAFSVAEGHGEKP